MLFPWNTPCDANTIRGQLKHSWLDNQILNKSAADVGFLRKQGSWPSLYSEFDTRLEDAQRLAGMIESGFSPALLIDSLTVFADLDARSRADLKQAVHAVYVTAFRPSDFVPTYEKAVKELRTAITDFRNAWDIQTNSGEDLVVGTWEQVIKRAKTLEKVLNSLPKGIVLP